MRLVLRAVLAQDKRRQLDQVEQGLHEGEFVLAIERGPKRRGEGSARTGPGRLGLSEPLSHRGEPAQRSRVLMDDTQPAEQLLARGQRSEPRDAAGGQRGGVNAVVVFWLSVLNIWLSRVLTAMS